MPSNEQKKAEEFNKKYPIGTPVRYWPGARHGKGCESKTRTDAQLLGNHTAVVWVENFPACLALSHIAPIVEKAAD